MRTALVLLFLLAAAAAVGSLLPQIPNSPERVASYRLAHPSFGTLFLRAGFFDVYGSWWFVLILTLLFVSLIACLLPRSRAMIRTIRQRPIQAREIDAFPQYRELRVPADPEAAAATARVEGPVGARSTDRVEGANLQPATLHANQIQGPIPAGLDGGDAEPRPGHRPPPSRRRSAS